MIPIITKKATTQMIATAFSCSGVGSVIPIASIIPLVNETRILIIMTVATGSRNHGFLSANGLCLLRSPLNSSIRPTDAFTGTRSLDSIDSVLKPSQMDRL